MNMFLYNASQAREIAQNASFACMRPCSILATAWSPMHLQVLEVVPEKCRVWLPKQNKYIFIHIYVKLVALA